MLFELTEHTSRWACVFVCVTQNTPLWSLGILFSLLQGHVQELFITSCHALSVVPLFQIIFSHVQKECCHEANNEVFKSSKDTFCHRTCEENRRRYMCECFGVGSVCWLIFLNVSVCILVIVCFLCVWLSQEHHSMVLNVLYLVVKSGRSKLCKCGYTHPIVCLCMCLYTYMYIFVSEGMSFFHVHQYWCNYIHTNP